MILIVKGSRQNKRADRLMPTDTMWQIKQGPKLLASHVMNHRCNVCIGYMHVLHLLCPKKSHTTGKETNDICTNCSLAPDEGQQTAEISILKIVFWTRFKINSD